MVGWIAGIFIVGVVSAVVGILTENVGIAGHRLCIWAISIRLAFERQPHSSTFMPTGAEAAKAK